LYSPQINPQLIPIIYKKAKELKMPMTKYVNGVLREKLIDKFFVQMFPNIIHSPNFINLFYRFNAMLKKSSISF